MFGALLFSEIHVSLAFRLSAFPLYKLRVLRSPAKISRMLTNPKRKTKGWTWKDVLFLVMLLAAFAGLSYVLLTTKG
jgi:hypothetical protein